MYVEYRLENTFFVEAKVKKLSKSSHSGTFPSLTTGLHACFPETRSSELPNMAISSGIQLNPGMSNFQGKFKLLRIIGVSSKKDKKHLIIKWFYARFYAYTCFIVRFLAMLEHKKSMKTTSTSRSPLLISNGLLQVRLSKLSRVKLQSKVPAGK